MTPKENINIAVLITCFNRKTQTLACLEALFKNATKDNLTLQVFLVDDGCTDGTGDAVRALYPDIQVLQGDGTLFWNGGMRLAFNAAMKIGFDYYLLLNDDTMLLDDALHNMIESECYIIESLRTASLVVGNVIDAKTEKITYGGRISRGWRQPLYYDFVHHQQIPIPCDTMNANCLLVPEEILQDVGGLDPVFQHGKADYDFGFRVRAKGYPIYVANAVIGNCSRNQTEDLTALENKTFIQRWHYLTSPKQFPIFEWFIYTKRHAGLFWFIHWLRPYRRLFSI